MPGYAALRINTPRVVHETIEDEVVIIDFDTGTYFSLSGVGAHVWRGIESGLEIPAIVAGVRNAFACDGTNVVADVAEFVRSLETEGLVVPVGADGGTGAVAVAPPTTVPGVASRPYAPPAVQRYTDMQALLLLDPIHEVDETGWPRVRGTDGP